MKCLIDYRQDLYTLTSPSIHWKRKNKEIFIPGRFIIPREIANKNGFIEGEPMTHQHPHDCPRHGRRPRGPGGTVSPKFEVAHASVPTNIRRSSVIGSVRKF